MQPELSMEQYREAYGVDENNKEVIQTGHLCAGGNGKDSCQVSRNPISFINLNHNELLNSLKLMKHKDMIYFNREIQEVLWCVKVSMGSGYK